ncbi:hypothetical protein BLNAU_23130 [Blattamonas nauphoetae]|uniref:Uncharacterized protein n=1 Tax=Blattamonas nauphoetae TaxID=2049346 RepID=A0ABQ9WR07_9EUKA|nr:hypothetical protein BLNAU_23130 [Blattamonas nauphoetae]
MFTNEQPISDDEIIPTSSALFRAVCVRERPIPSVPRTSCELNEHATIEIDRVAPKSGNTGVSTKPCNWPLSLEIEHCFITTDDCDADSSNVDGEIRIGLVPDETSIKLSDIVRMLLETIASFFGQLETSEKWSDFIDIVEFVNENMQFSPIAGQCVFLEMHFGMTVHPTMQDTCS